MTSTVIVQRLLEDDYDPEEYVSKTKPLLVRKYIGHAEYRVRRTDTNKVVGLASTYRYANGVTEWYWKQVAFNEVADVSRRWFDIRKPSYEALIADMAIHLTK